MNKLQLTLAVLKPDISLNEKAVSEIRKIILQDNYLFIRTKFHKLTLNQAKDFYKVHEKKFFYNRLVYSMSSGPIWCHILARENAIKEWRKLMGPTKVFKTIYDDPNSLRGNYGVTDTRNTLHGSDSDENAKAEMDFFFPEFDFESWYAKEESQFRDPNNLISKIKCTIEIMPLNYLKKYLYLSSTLNLIDPVNSKLLSNVFTAIQLSINHNKTDDLLKLLNDYLQFNSSLNLKNSNQIGSSINCVAFYLACCARLSKNENFTHKVYETLINTSETPMHLFAFEHFCDVASEIEQSKNSSEQAEATVTNRNNSKHIGRGHKKALIKWFFNKNELDLIKLLTQYRHSFNWTIKDLLKLIHMKPKNEGHDLIMRYLLFGYRRIQDENISDEFKQVLEFIHDLEKLKYIKIAQEATDLIRKHKFQIGQIPSRIFKFKEIWPALIEQMNTQDFYEYFYQILKKDIIRPNSNIEKFIFDHLLNRNNPDYVNITPISNCIAAQIYERLVFRKQLRTPRGLHRSNNVSILEDKSSQDRFRDYLWSAFRNTIQLNKSQSKSFFNLNRIMVVTEINSQMRNSNTLGLNYLNPLETSICVLLTIFYLNNIPTNVDVFVSSDRLTRIELADKNTQAEPDLGSLDQIVQGFVSIDKNPTDKIFEWTLQNEKFYDVFVFLVSSDQNNNKIQSEIDFVRANTIAKDTKLIIVNLTGKVTENEHVAISPSQLDLYLNGWNFDTFHLIESFLKGIF
ncbi:unnamed protein product [Brachionus calyciflorus]|uniref:Nucleoside diphosphate kinase-like domain-containing protein n=1 Tax=Brachionus calyciflorus TaxID=104777 RepID=A0A813M443_9BILA|nr:unnamed protein product [Brachionus calyciflorus]